MADNLQELQNKIEHIKNYIIMCDARIAKGEKIDLQGLDENIEKICTEVTSLPAKQGKRFQIELKNIIEALDKLVDTIYNQQQIKNN